MTHRLLSMLFALVPALAFASRDVGPDLRAIPTTFRGGLYTFKAPSASFGLLLRLTDSDGTVKCSIFDTGAVTLADALTIVGGGFNVTGDSTVIGQITTSNGGAAYLYGTGSAYAIQRTAGAIALSGAGGIVLGRESDGKFTTVDGATITGSDGTTTIGNATTITGTLGGLTGLTVDSGGIVVTGDSTITGTLNVVDGPVIATRASNGSGSFQRTGTPGPAAYFGDGNFIGNTTIGSTGAIESVDTMTIQKDQGTAASLSRTSTNGIVLDVQNGAWTADSLGATSQISTVTVTTGGINITGNSTIAGTLGSLTGLTVASGGASVAGGLTVDGDSILQARAIYNFGILGAIGAVAVDRFAAMGTSVVLLNENLMWRAPVAGTIRNLYAHAGTGPDSALSETTTITIRQNGGDTAVTCTLSGSGVDNCTDLANSVGLGVGDTITVRATQSAVTAITADIAISFEFAF